MRSIESSSTPSAMFLALVVCFVSDPPVANAQATCAQEVASIQAYSKRIDKLIKQKQSFASKQTFVRHQSDARELPGHWTEVGGDEDSSISGFTETASAWTLEGNIVAAQLIVQSLSQNRVHRVLYYYREDGTLARISSTLDSSLGSRIVVREQFYDRSGVALSTSSQHYTLRAKAKPGQGWVEEPVPVFLKVTELPFYRALRVLAAPSHSR